MIYLVGMSHSFSLINAVSAQDSGMSQVNYSVQAAKTFQPIAVKPGALPGDQLQALIVSAQGWDILAGIENMQDGTRTLHGHPEFATALHDVPAQGEGSCIVSMVDGNGHASVSVLQHQAPYDFILPGHEDWGIQTGFRPLPPELIREQLMPYQRHTIAILALMRRMLPKVRLVHVLPPPPAHAEQILNGPEVFAESIAKYGITPLLVRRKYYAMANRILAEETRKYGVELLEAPVQCYDTDGALLDQYADGATHANAAYGELVAEQIRKLF